MIDIAVLFALALCCILGIGMTAIRMPGTWLIVLSAAGYGWYDAWHSIGKMTIVILIGVAVVGEILEFFSSVVTARRAGASRKAGWGGLIGGTLGMFCLSPTIAVVPIGPVIGALLGCFIGATVGEMIVRNKLVGSARVGVFSALGMALGTAAKLGLSFVMAAILLTAILTAHSATS